MQIIWYLWLLIFSYHGKNSPCLLFSAGISCTRRSHSHSDLLVTQPATFFRLHRFPVASLYENILATGAKQQAFTQYILWPKGNMNGNHLT